MADSIPSAQATSKRDWPKPAEGGNKNHSETIHQELCIHCQALTFNERDLQRDITTLSILYTRRDTLPNLPSITATAIAGCHFCKMLLSSEITQHNMKLHGSGFTQTPISIEFYYLWKWPPLCIERLVARTTVGTELGNFAKQWTQAFLVEADPDTPCAKLLGIQTKTFLPNWSFDEKMALIRNWIGDCENSHDPVKTLPTRLLDLSSSRDPIHDVRLIYSKDIPQSIACRYAALSHCWGSPDRPPLKTEMNSLHKMLCNIPFASLPANYQDAIRVARGLGIDYLWIDSLCIVQDSVQDWDAEASHTVDVYRQAHVTIVAATGNCCHDGFLNPKADERVKISTVSSLTGSPINDTFYFREEYRANTDIQSSPWNQRGWTFQESAFSTRRLFFTRNSFSYSHQSSQYLYLMDGRREPIYDIQPAKSWLREYASSSGTNWLHLIEQYSERHFTILEDRLPAISAWAQLISQKTNDRYFAGVWKGNLTFGLLWRCEATSSTQTLAERLKFTLEENFVAPSWSWASQKRSIRYSWKPVDVGKCSQILEIEVSPIGANPFGRFKSGYVVVSGVVRPLPITPTQRCANFFQSTVGRRVIHYHMDWWEENMDVMSGIFQDVKMLLLAHCLDLKTTIIPIHKACGLLVLPTGAHEEYWRVGMFSIELDWRDGKFVLPSFDRAWSTIKIV